MKTFILSAPFFVFSVAEASQQVQLQCQLLEDITVAQFNASALLTIADDKTVTGQVVFATLNRVDEDHLVTHDPIQVHGNLETFPAGSMYVDATDSYQLFSADQPGVALQLNTGNEDHFSSRLVINGESTYVSNCQYFIAPPPSLR